MAESSLGSSESEFDRSSARLISASESHGGCTTSASSCSELCSSSDSAVTSLLSRLRAPKASDLARKRRIQVNPPVGKKRGKGCVTNDPKSVATERITSCQEELCLILCASTTAISLMKVACK